jgi:starvation-inducible DNA-binding protein
MSMSTATDDDIFDDSEPVTGGSALQSVLDLLNDVALTLKHAHWNVTGPSFIAVHTMLDSQAAEVRDMADTVAERMAAMGQSPDGRADGIVRRRQGGAYELARADALTHLAALDARYTRVIDTCAAVAEGAAGDPVTRDLLTSQRGELEKLRWLVRAHGA